MGKMMDRSPQKDIPVLPADTHCNARKRIKKGRPKPKNPYCTKRAGWGTDHLGFGRCKLHGGNVPNHRQAAQKQLAKAGVEDFGLPLNIEPQDALLQELHRTAGIIAFYEAQIRDFDQAADLAGPVGTEGTAVDTGLEHNPQVQANVFVRLHQDERAHLVKVADTCIRAGIAERQVQIAEQQGALLATVIRLCLQDLKVDLNAPKTREVVRTRLLEASQQAIDGTATPILDTISNGKGNK